MSLNSGAHEVQSAAALPLASRSPQTTCHTSDQTKKSNAHLLLRTEGPAELRLTGGARSASLTLTRPVQTGRVQWKTE
ncbi:hypothetical protein SKAU_G00285910 [Synaphobranchus kaupii]|uniref:Uncharacterized protein n=1 Tax=Synaphobranchus kaupii TaxID=118154 RepID=A0A9Q1EY37_SYNKA|nr:hypothetical protein SKAU_G00285910 [Synaphobranchus kaupii]